MLCVGTLVLSAVTCSVSAAELWVSPDGDDASLGTREKPLASIEAAQRRARELRRLEDPSITNGIRIILRGGVYRLDSPLLFRWEDSGTETSPTVIEAAPGERPVLSGGVVLEHWRKVDRNVPGLPEAAQGKVWMADTPKFGGRLLEPRQLWIDGRKAVRARKPDAGVMERLVTWDKHQREAGIPASFAGPYRDLSHMEMVIHQQWEIAFLRLKTLKEQSNRVRVTFQEPESRLQFEHPWPAPVMTNGNSPFFLVNAVEFLDQPGEWFQRMPGGRMLYYPRPEEEMTNAQAVVPALETLVKVQGTLDRPVAWIQFKGVGFEHSAWTRPSQFGHVPLQAGMYFLEAYRIRPPELKLDNKAWVGRPPAGVTVSGAHHIRFERCRFEHMAMDGLDFESGTHDDVVEGCLFRDIGGNGLLVGKFSDEGVEAHVPYNPSDEREICTRERIANNLFTDCGNEDWGCLGIGVGYGREVTVEHNELNNLPYTGINVGWGWKRDPNCMRDNIIRANNIHHIGTQMADFGGVYTLSAQPGTVISENAVHSIQVKDYVHNTNHWFYLYTDEGSSYITVRDNWTERAQFLQNNNGPGNVWTNNGQNVSIKIKEAAGLQKEFRDLGEEK